MGAVSPPGRSTAQARADQDGHESAAPAMFGSKHIGGDREGAGGRDRGTPTREGAGGKAPIPIPPLCAGSQTRRTDAGPFYGPLGACPVACRNTNRTNTAAKYQNATLIMANGPAMKNVREDRTITIQNAVTPTLVDGHHQVKGRGFITGPRLLRASRVLRPGPAARPEGSRSPTPLDPPSRCRCWAGPSRSGR